MKDQNIPNYKAFASKKRKKKNKSSNQNDNFLLTSPNFSNKRKKRVGRGPSSKIGKTCGRGMKGQKARNTVKKGFEGGQMPLHRRLPKFGFKSHKENNFSIVNLYQLEKIQSNDISKKELLEHKLISKLSSRVKILGDGNIEKSVKIAVDAFSSTARIKIEKAGGTCSIITQ